MFKIGDIVQIRRTLQAGEGEPYTHANSDMQKMAGQYTIITQILADHGWDYTRYRIKNSNWIWTENMFEPKMSILTWAQKGD